MSTNNLQSIIDGGTSTPLEDFLGSSSALNSLPNQNTNLDLDKLNAINSALRTATGGVGLQLSPILQVADCAKSLEDRILSTIQAKATDLLLQNETAADLVGKINSLMQLGNSLKSIYEMTKSAKDMDLASGLLLLSKLSGIEQQAHIAKMRETFGKYVSNINDLISNVASLDICSLANISSSGTPVPPPSPIPVGLPFVPSAHPAPTVNSAQLESRGSYADMMMRLKEATSKTVGREADPEHMAMVTAVNTIIMAYHKKIFESTDSSVDAAAYEAYSRSIEIERAKFASSWSADTLSEYSNRATQGGTVIRSSTDVIRSYAQLKNTNTTSGSLLGTGITVYSGVMGDLTTFLEVKREERPPEAVAYWSSKVNIAEQEARMNRRGLKTSYIPYEWSVSTAYKGKAGLNSDFTCATTRVPGGSVLALKNPDGTPYNPSGRNASGLFTVTDTGNATLTYKKVDIYTNTPKVYTNMDKVQVFLVSRGTQTNSQYAIAQKRYGGGAVV